MDEISVLLHQCYFPTFLFSYLYVLTQGNATIETIAADFIGQELILAPMFDEKDEKKCDNNEPKNLLFLTKIC